MGWKHQLALVHLNINAGLHMFQESVAYFRIYNFNFCTIGAFYSL